jgi:UDP-N-acetylglucosamine:LPS N-acetylglucosamine transferase
MGQGHLGASKEIAARVVQQGHDARIVDFLDAFPLHAGKAWKEFYLLQLRRFPESYESTYQLFYHHSRLWKPFVQFERVLAQRAVMRWVETYSPDVIVSTYSFATLVVGELRARGRISVPTVNFLTDFAVHPRAVHPGIDLNLAIHPRPAAAAAERTGRRTLAPGPAVPPIASATAPNRLAARDGWGIGADEPMVLVTSGSWGVGTGLEDTVQLLANAGWRVFVACGTDEALRSRLEARRLGTALGWTDRMAELVVGSDVIIENAGGMTSLEAFAAGVPTVTYKPIPGHGRDNAREMAAAGVTWLAADDDDLLRALDRLSGDTPERARQLDATKAMFAADPVDDVLALVA